MTLHLEQEVVPPLHSIPKKITNTVISLSVEEQPMSADAYTLDSD